MIPPSEPFIEIQHEVFASRGDSQKKIRVPDRIRTHDPP